MSFSALLRGYLIIPLSERMMNRAAWIAHRKTRVAIGKETSTHHHRLFSFYFADGMKALRTPRGDLPLPPRALVVVFPFVSHGWTNRGGATDESYVHDLTPLHRPHAVH
ncbi:MAG: hypothetical protein AAGG07_05755 [Planctomycetota bacterium]